MSELSQASVKKNFFYNLIGNLVTILVPLITTPYLSRVLGVDGIGAYSFSYSNVSYFILIATFGSSIFAQREIASNRNNLFRISQIFWEIIVLRAIFSVLSLGLYFLVFFKIGIDTLIFVQSINILCVMTDITWFYQGLQDFKKIAVRSIIIKLLFVFFTFISIKSQNDLTLYALGYAIIQILANLSLWLYFPKYLKFSKVSIKNIVSNISPSFFLFIPTIATQIYTVLDKSMLGFITSSNIQNGLYEQAEKIVRMSLIVYTAYGGVVSPKIASLKTENKINEIKKQLHESIRVMWFFILPMTTGVIAISKIFVPWYLGYGYEGVVPLLRIFSFLFIFVGLSNIFAVQYLVPVKKHNIFTISVILGAFINLFLNFILIPKFFALGAAIASIIAEAIITLFQLYFIVQKDRILSIREIFAPSISYMISSFLMMITIFTFSHFLPTTTISIFITIIIGASMYLVALILYDDVVVKKIKLSILSKIKKKKHC